MTGDPKPPGRPAPWPNGGAVPELTRRLAKVRGICLDIDDTLSTAGKLTAGAFAALWRAKEAGFAVVPITGRPAGWCDHIARFWPVDAVVGENGAFAFFIKEGVRRRLDTPAGAPPADLRARLGKLGESVRARFPRARWASDQAFRECDLAIDICEDVPPWPREDIDALLELCRAAGAHAKLSSIHVNTWFGEYDKLKGFDHWRAKGAPGLALKSDVRLRAREGWIFIGDSPNDEPMFQGFAHSVGVANLGAYLPQLRHAPTWVTEGASGAGFAQFVEGMVQAKSF